MSRHSWRAFSGKGGYASPQKYEYLQHSNPIEGSENGDCAGYCYMKRMGRDQGAEWAAQLSKVLYDHFEKDKAIKDS